jgi:hypothetical protein
VETDWSVACGTDDPTVVVPWIGRDESIRYIDLHNEPTRINEIPEAAQYPSLAAALRRWNQPDAPLFTAKCDVWNYPADLFDAEDLPGFAYAQGSYVDLLSREIAIFSSFAACEQMLRVWSVAARNIALPEGRCEWTLRPACILPLIGNAENYPLDESGNRNNGFATTLYVWGYGSSPEAAAAAWSNAILALIEPVLLFGRS